MPSRNPTEMLIRRCMGEAAAVGSRLHMPADCPDVLRHRALPDTATVSIVSPVVDVGLALCSCRRPRPISPFHHRRRPMTLPARLAPGPARCDRAATHPGTGSCGIQGVKDGDPGAETCRSEAKNGTRKHSDSLNGFVRATLISSGTGRGKQMQTRSRRLRTHHVR